MNYMPNTYGLSNYTSICPMCGSIRGTMKANYAAPYYSHRIYGNPVTYSQSKRY